jgi:hypothetical protein
VTWPEFLDYYAEIAASTPHDVDYAVRVIERVWGVKEQRNDLPALPENMLAKVEHVLREKVRQRTSSAGNEAQTLRTAFQHFDLNESGSLDYAPFCLALERFGVVLDAGVTTALFDSFATNGHLDYVEFAAVLYANDELSASYKPKKLTAAVDNAASFAAAAAADASFAGASMTTASSAPPPGAVAAAILIPVQGAPFSGKSTTCARLAEESGAVVLSADALLNACAADAESEVGVYIRACDEQGAPIPVMLVCEVIIAAIESVIESHGAGSTPTVLLDGFPHSLGVGSARVLL